MLVERLAVYPAFARNPDRWLELPLRSRVRRATDAEGFARVDPWSPGTLQPPPFEPRASIGRNPVARLLDRAVGGKPLSEQDVVALFASRSDTFHAVCAAADALRAETRGSAVSYVVTRNINYTNVCSYRCRFCAFSKGRLSENLRGKPYNLDLQEIQRRTQEAWDRGAVEVCLQGGIHPSYDGSTYLSICRAIKDVCPAIHVHAFSPLEIWQGAATLGMAVGDFLTELKAAGLGSLPGTAAEILDDVRNPTQVGH